MIGAVLTGGSSTRMGRDKALLPVGGVPMASRVALALVEAGATRVVCVGGDVAALRAAGLEAVPDEHPGEGPLGGMVTALAQAGPDEDVVLVAPCDLTAPDPAGLGALVAALAGAARADVAVPLVDGRRAPLPAAWRPAVHHALRARFDGGARSPSKVLDDLAVVDVPLPAAGTADADVPEDLPPGAEGADREGG